MRDSRAVLFSEQPQSSLLSPQSFRYPALDALLLLFILNLTLQPLVEPDFGWHLRTGLDLIRNGWQLPSTDPYSHTMPDWPWVEHAWLTDGLLGLTYQGLGSTGALGVILLFCILTTGAFFVASKLSDTVRTCRLLAMAAALWVALPFLGARTQLVSLLGLATVLWFFDCARRGQTTLLWWLLPLFLLWANLHGGFTAGLFVLLLSLVASLIVRLTLDRWPALTSRISEPVMTWPQIVRVGLIIGTAALVTLVNPYGWRLHIEIYQSLSDRFMVDTLHEWQPVSLEGRAGINYVLYVLVLGLAWLVGNRRIEPVRWIVLAVFLGLSLRYWRNVPLFLVISVPVSADLTAALAARLMAAAPSLKTKARQWLLGLTLAVGIWVSVLGADHLERIAWAGLRPAQFFTQTEYPIEAVQWVQTHRDQLGTKLYNDYVYGGFLLWWLPGENIFIDGRMPGWRIGDRWIFYDYVALTSWDPPALGVLDKYGVDWAIVQHGTPLEQALGQQGTWTVPYADSKVVLYMRPRL